MIEFRKVRNLQILHSILKFLLQAAPSSFVSIRPYLTLKNLLIQLNKQTIRFSKPKQNIALYPQTYIFWLVCWKKITFIKTYIRFILSLNILYLPIYRLRFTLWQSRCLLFKYFYSSISERCHLQTRDTQNILLFIQITKAKFYHYKLMNELFFLLTFYFYIFFNPVVTAPLNKPSSSLACLATLKLSQK